MGLSGHADPSAIIAVTIAFTVIAGVAVLLRLYSRMCVARSAGWDDAFICFALIWTIGQTVAVSFQVKYGMGRHIATLTPYELTTSLKPFYASIVVYNLALFSTKFSIMLQYLRIFPHRRFRIMCYSLMAFVFAWSCWTVFSAIFFCTPVAKFWDPKLDGHCFSEWAVWFSNAGVNIVTDILVATLPLPFLSQLQLPRRQRIALITVFALGGFTCIISILRLESLLTFLHNTDISWNNPLAAIWSSVEVNTGILCSCLPTLKALVTRLFPRVFHSSYLQHSGSEARRPSGPFFNATSSNNTQRHKANKLSFDALGRGLTGRDIPLTKTTISHNEYPHDQSGRSGESDSLEELEFGVLRGKRPEGREGEDGIQVVTVVEQEVEKGRSLRGRGSDDASTRELVPSALLRGGSAFGRRGGGTGESFF